MSPDSLDFPFMARRALNWDVYNSSHGPAQDRRDTHKPRAKRDRSRRATLNGPIIQLPLEPTSVHHKATIVRRNSIEIPTIESEVIPCARSRNQKERGMTEPKQIKTLSPREATACEHSCQLLSPAKNYFPCNGAMCKKFEVSSSLDDISEKSELNSDSVSLRPEANRITSGTLQKPEELDMDSLEASEFKKLDISETLGSSALVSIVEEPDLLSDRSCDYHTDDLLGHSSGSASEGAVMIGVNSNSSCTDQQTAHNTDTDMEMPSDDDFSQTKDNNIDELARIIEPDSLLNESFVAVKGDVQEISHMADNDSTRDVSLETDSLELKK